MTTKCSKPDVKADTKGNSVKTQRRYKIGTKNTCIHGKTGIVSQHMLSSVLGNSQETSEKIPKADLLVSEGKVVPNPESKVMTSKDSGLEDNLSGESIEEAVHKLIELNKDKLTESQLVDLIASFYLVANKCLRKQKTETHLPLNNSSPHNEVGDDNERKDISVQETPVVKGCVNSSDQRPLTLMELKRLQWLQKQTELDRASKNRMASATDSLPRPAVSGSGDSGGSRSSQSPSTTPPAKDFHRFQRCTYLGGLPLGEDPLAEAQLKEQQRRQWLAELDQQVAERREARERERLQRLAVEAAEAATTEYAAVAASTVPDTDAQKPLETAVSLESTPTKFCRGRGLADLLGKEGLNQSVKRQQQLELQAAYAEQIAERTERRRLEREAELRAEAVAAAEAESARLRFIAELQREQQRQAATSDILANHQHSEEPVQRAQAKNSQASVAFSKPARNEPQCSTRKVSQIPCPTKGSTSQHRASAKSQFESTYTIPTSGAGTVVRASSVPEGTPVVLTESSLLPAAPPAHFGAAAPPRPTSDFLAAISDPDFVHPEVSRDSALQQVSKIRENLAQRRNELRLMQYEH